MNEPLLKSVARTIGNIVELTIENRIQPDALLAPEQLGERFDRHVRNQNIQGAGLGLSIVKKIISMHHGKVIYDATKSNTLIVKIELLAPLIK